MQKMRRAKPKCSTASTRGLDEDEAYSAFVEEFLALCRKVGAPAEKAFDAFRYWDERRREAPRSGRPRLPELDRAFAALVTDAIYRLGMRRCTQLGIRPSQERAILEALRAINRHAPTRPQVRDLGRRLSESRQYLRDADPAVIEECRRLISRIKL